jgi:hypothetical protein
VRGDSLRDFYAKTLAVLGLGVIAGAGAIVDYWPTGVRLPATTSPSIARLTLPQLAQNLTQEVPEPTFAVARPLERSVDARHVRWPGFVPKPQATVASAHAAIFTPPAGSTPPPPEPAPAPVAAKLTVPVTYSTPVSEWTPDVLVAAGITSEQLDAAADRPEPVGFIGGALKKTKDSLAKTGAVTSASFSNAVRGFVGAFKKVSPF